MCLQYEREEAGALPKVLVKQKLQFLYPLAGVEQYLPDALKQVKPSPLLKPCTGTWPLSLFRGKAQHLTMIWIPQQGKSAEEIVAWMDQEGGDASSLPEFSRFVTLQLLQSSLGDGKVGDSLSWLQGSIMYHNDESRGGTMT